MKRSKAEKRLAVLVHNAAFEQAKEDQANALLSTDAGPRGTTTTEEAEEFVKNILDPNMRMHFNSEVVTPN